MLEKMCAYFIIDQLVLGRNGWFILHASHQLCFVHRPNGKIFDVVNKIKTQLFAEIIGKKLFF